MSGAKTRAEDEDDIVRQPEVDNQAILFTLALDIMSPRARSA